MPSTACQQLPDDQAQSGKLICTRLVQQNVKLCLFERIVTYSWIDCTTPQFAMLGYRSSSFFRSRSRDGRGTPNSAPNCYCWCFAAFCISWRRRSSFLRWRQRSIRHHEFVIVFRTHWVRFPTLTACVSCVSVMSQQRLTTIRGTQMELLILPLVTFLGAFLILGPAPKTNS